MSFSGRIKLWSLANFGAQNTDMISLLFRGCGVKARPPCHDILIACFAIFHLSVNIVEPQ